MSAKLRALRKDNSIPVEEMMSLLGLKTRAAYYKKESGHIKVSLEEAKLIADKFKCTIEEIFFDIEVSKRDTKGGAIVCKEAS